MLICKLFEVRDKGTYIPCFGIQLYVPSKEQIQKLPDAQYYKDIAERERYIMRRSGYSEFSQLVLFGRVNGGECWFDPYSWSKDSRRAMFTAHDYVQKCWEKLKSGDVIDVQYILGETTIKKQSEQITSPIAANL